MFGHLLGWYTIYTFWGALAREWNFARSKIHFVSKSCALLLLAALLHSTRVMRVRQTLRRWAEGATYIRQGGHHVGHRPTFYTVSQKNVPPLAWYSFDAHKWIRIFFGRNVTDEVGNQKMLYYATSNNLCFYTTWQNAETQKSHTSLKWIVLHTQCTCVLSSWKKVVICDVFDSV